MSILSRDDVVSAEDAAMAGTVDDTAAGTVTPDHENKASHIATPGPEIRKTFSAIVDKNVKLHLELTQQLKVALASESMKELAAHDDDIAKEVSKLMGSIVQHEDSIARAVEGIEQRKRNIAQREAELMKQERAIEALVVQIKVQEAAWEKRMKDHEDNMALFEQRVLCMITSGFGASREGGQRVRTLE